MAYHRRLGLRLWQLERRVFCEHGTAKARTPVLGGVYYVVLITRSMSMASRKSLVCMMLLLLLASSCGDKSATSSTSPPSSTSPTTVPATAGVVWPAADGSVPYADPVEAAAGFATEFIGFTEPLVGEFQRGDSRSGEVEIRPTATGPVTTVLLRQVANDDSWWVLGAVTDAISPTAPARDSIVKSPVLLQGSSTAFEGTVDVAVRSRSTARPLAEGFVTGGSMGEVGPFDSTLEFANSATPDGAIVFSTSSMEDGRVWEATVVAVRFS
ncbi:MAG: hypothetical protein F2694_09135 [Actinobacteria bacterium]|nr:hypothetical protein [Actinomycetota bacterium]